MKIINGILLALLGVFTFLLYSIITQYFPFRSDAAFLGIKIEEREIPYYLFWFKVHVFLSGPVLLAGFTQFSSYIRKRWRKLHRGMGYSYVLLVLFAAAPSGLVLGYHALGGVISSTAFILLGLLWIYTTAMAWRYAVKRNWKQHKFFMIRSYALTLSAVTLRLLKPIIVALWEPAPMDTYHWVAWLGWVVNALIAEAIIYKKKKHLPVASASF